MKAPAADLREVQIPDTTGDLPVEERATFDSRHRLRGRLARPVGRRATALIPCHSDPPDPALVERVRDLAGDVLLVDDGSPLSAARKLESIARETGVELLRLPANGGKGNAIASGLRHLLSRSPAPEAVIVLDADGQHPPEAIPSFLASDAELVIGDRFGDLRAMPWQRRRANRIASSLLSLACGRPVRDSQCGMRLLRGRALTEVAFPNGRYEAETRHLKRCLCRGIQVAWVPIPTLYDGQRSSFRPLRDTLRVLAALLG